MCAVPDAIDTYCPSSGGVDCPFAFRPQHAIPPWLKIPHVWNAPTDSARYVAPPKSGGVAWPSVFRPQHVGTPVSVSAQLCRSPTSTDA